MPNIPEKPALEGLEAIWSTRWRENGTYRFDPETTRAEVYSIDTPPPTASGSLHVGHMFSYTQTDVLARYQRMCGKNVFYPLGWDDNGLPTERRVQNYYGVRCDPTLPYDPHFQPPEQAPKNERDYLNISRPNFIELCEALTEEDEKVFADLFTTLGLSVDWALTYRTIDTHSRATSQRAFLDNYEAGDAYAAEAPTLWDVTFRTAVAQAELEDRERPGAFHKVAFHRTANNDSSADTAEKTDPAETVYIETTRPELIPAVVALVAHPEDERYQELFGSTVFSPLFGVEVEVKPHPLAKPDKGTGLVMVCTFGDLTDVTWWRELDLPTRAIVGRDGRVLPDTPEWIQTGKNPAASEHYTALASKTTFSAREAIVELLRSSGDLVGEPKPITHPVNFYEKGDKPLEVVTSRQWYLRNGGRDAQRRQRLIDRGREVDFHPSFMRSRYENWVEGLTGDWLVSRQRFFGVPIPLWYPLDAAGNPDYEHPIRPDNASLPVDPAAEPAPGYTAEQRNQAGGFIADPDILDTWATSSLTPQIVGGWNNNPELFDKVFPFDLRPQGHDIIRTWLFSSMVRADALQNQAPWRHAAISGWILDPDRKKMSKSKGNVVVPNDVLEQFGSDAVRYWAASAKLGVDTAYEVAQMKIGRRLAIKLLNAAKFSLNLGASASQILPADSSLAELVLAGSLTAVDASLLSQLSEVIRQASTAFEAYDYARALQLVENFFWSFTDDYVELVKERAYGGAGEAGQQSAQTTLATALDALLRLFAPVLPFVTDEVWSWWRSGSVHEQSWPSPLPADAATAPLLSTVATALAGLRKGKTEAKVKQRTPVHHAVIVVPEAKISLMEQGLADLRAAANAQKLSLQAGDDFDVTDIELGAEQ